MAELEEEDAEQHGSILGATATYVAGGVKGLFSGLKDQDPYGDKQVQILSGM